MTEESRAGNDTALLVEKYIKLRDKKAALDKEHKQKMQRFTNAMHDIEALIRATLTKTNAESIRTKAGTAFTKTVLSATVDSRDDFLDFVRDSESWQFVESRVNKTAVQEYIDEHADVPPGVKISRFDKIFINRA